ncbi:MAG TPA: ABC transporter ATP-binding protein [Acidimicrobiia bacterium]|jgi:ABC-2 type transport system ATP-binding protein|nr:ABC transporter ATP-binding protein [Acidimicrobiia bacterium]
MTMAAPTILTRRLTKRYGETTVVDGLDLRLGAGEVFGLLGPNGAGKTTTILMLLGLVEPTSGEIEVLGLDPARHPLAVKSRVGYLPDAVGFYDGMTGRENLRFTAALNQIERREAEERIARLLEEVGLAAAADQAAGTYSRGMRQRLGIADALVKDPAILILDEPTTAIDPEGVAEMLGLIRSLADDRGVTILLSSHLLHQVQTVCDRVAIFVRGKVVVQGAPHDLASESKGPEQVEVQVGADEGAVRAAVAGEKFLRSLRPGRIPRSYLIEIDRGSTNQLVSRLVGAGLPLTSVRRISEDLDEVYRRYFHAEEVKTGA